MKVYRRIEEIDIQRPTVLSVGSFDGIHLGHQQILNELSKQSQDCNCLEVLVTFHPHPKIVVGSYDRRNIELLTTLEEKIQILERLELPVLLVLPFTKEFSQMSYQDFVKNILVNRLNIEKIVIGNDHAFGRNREGHSEQLKNMGKQYRFDVSVMKPFLVNGAIVNSTKIRKIISNGDMDSAHNLLGRPYSIVGTVEKGSDRGKSIGFPTANIRSTDPYKLIPKKGVYAVDVILHNKKYQGMMNIGNRPTFNFDPLTLEVHIFNFSGHIYGEKLEVIFKKFIREEKKYNNAEELKDQILKDKEVCLNL